MPNKINSDEIVKAIASASELRNSEGREIFAWRMYQMIKKGKIPGVTLVTDSAMAEMKAQGVEIFTARLQRLVNEGDFVGDEIVVIRIVIDCGKETAKQLREGAGK